MQPNGMVMEPGAVEERLEQIRPQQRRDDSNDIWFVKNIDLNCSMRTWDTIRITEKWRDTSEEGRGRVVTKFRDVSSQYDHAEGFTVKWSNQPITIKPGEIKRMPKYIAEHYVQKLADHILDKRGPEKMLRNDPIIRPQVEAEIVIRKEEFIADMPLTVGQQAVADIEALNSQTTTAPYVNADGNAYNDGQKSVELDSDDIVATDMIPTGTGNLRTSEIEPTEQVIARMGNETGEDGANIPTNWQGTSKSDIIKLIRDMTPDYKFGQNMSKGQLVAILERNY